VRAFLLRAGQDGPETGRHGVHPHREWEAEHCNLVEILYARGTFLCRHGG